MTRLHCPLPDCGWSVPYLSPPEPTGIPDFDQHMREAADHNQNIASQIRDLHATLHTPSEFARVVAAAAPGVRQANTLHVVCPISGCRWERDVHLSPSGFWASLFHVGTAAEVSSVYAERSRHLTRHDTTVLARTLEHLTPKDTDV